MADNANKSVAKVQDRSIMEEVIVKGNLADLTGEQRAEYYLKVCESMGLNPFTKPFEYIELDKKLVLYATRNATDQLRQHYGVDIKIVSEETTDNMRIVTVQATTRDGRVDTDIAVVPLEKEDGEWAQSSNGKSYFKKNGKMLKLAGADLANAYMKAITKAKRRVTLSVCGLSFIDESELETVSRKKASSITVADDLHALEADNGNPAQPAAVEQVDGELMDDEPSMDAPSKAEADDWRDQIKTMYAMTDEKAKRGAIGPLVAQAEREWWRFHALIVFATNKALAERMHEKAAAAGADVVKLDEWMGDFEMAQAMTVPA